MNLIEIEKAQKKGRVDIYNSKKQLIKTIGELEIESENTNFLEEVANDYKKYNKVIIEQKNKQQMELLKLLGYLNDLSDAQAVTKYTLSHTKNEQQRLINEIKDLQTDMNDILS